jgi:osmotically inducible protein OsmC
MAYTASATTTAGRNGHVESSDGVVKFDLSMPKELGGTGKAGATNPEQLFSAGYSACFGSAVDAVARAEKTHVDSIAITAETTIDKNDDGFFLAVKLKAKIGGVDKATAQHLIEKAHHVCPYSKATQGNIKVELETV